MFFIGWEGWGGRLAGKFDVPLDPSRKRLGKLGGDSSGQLVERRVAANMKGKGIGEMATQARIEELDHRSTVAKFAGKQKQLTSAVKKDRGVGIGKTREILRGSEKPPGEIFGNKRSGFGSEELHDGENLTKNRTRVNL